MQKQTKLLLADLGIYEKKFVPLDEISDDNKDQIIKSEGYNYIIDNKGLSAGETQLLLFSKQTMYLKSIASMLKFFTILVAISLVISFILFFI